MNKIDEYSPFTDIPVLTGNETSDPSLQNIAEEFNPFQDNRNSSRSESYELEEDFFNSVENFLPDISKAVRLNRFYGNELGWNKFYDQINDMLLPYSGLQNVSLGEEAFAQAVAVWQKQQGFSKKDCDGIIGPNTWEKMQPYILKGNAIPQTPMPSTGSSGNAGFPFLKYSLSNKKIIIQKKDDKRQYSEIKESPAVFLKAIVRDAGEDPDRWFDRFTRITFLGRSLKSNQYIQENFAIHLKKLEKKFAAQFGGPNSDPSIAGDNLKLTHEGMAGSRLVSSTATYSYHMFGLAVDINYSGCPYIQARQSFNKFMGKVSKLVTNIETKGVTWGMSIPASPEKYLKLYDNLSVLNNYLKKYFSFLEAQNEHALNLSLRQCSYEPWNGLDISRAKEIIKKDLKDISRAWKGGRSDPENIFKNGFLGLSRDFVKGMVESGLDWGARYGDIMHFDMRTATGIGSKIERAKNNYIHAVKTKARKLYALGNREYLSVPEYENEDNDNFQDSYESGNVYEPYEHEEYLNSPEEPAYELQQDFLNSVENFFPDISKAVRLNRFYGDKLGWNRFYDQINDMLLPYSGLQNVSLSEEAFAQAVTAWQKQHGFSEKDSDGIIGPQTWAKMQAQLNLPAATVPAKNISSATVSRIQKYSDAIERISKQHGLNPNITRGIIAAESGGNYLSGEERGGYKGLMQADTTKDQLEPEISLKTGIEKFIKFRDKILNPWLKKFSISIPSENNENYLKACLSCYNAGPVTALKAIQYANTSGNWQQWLSPEHYKRALLFSGGYAYYSTCNKGISKNELDKAKAERLRYRFKTSGWRTEPDPPAWNIIHSSLDPVMRCWIETKYQNTPGYLDRFINYFKYFENYSSANVINEESGYYEEASKPEQENETKYSGTLEINDEPEYQHYSDELNEFEMDLSKAVRLNRYYADKLCWNKFYDQINDLLLPYSGLRNVSLGEEAFAQAVAEWQKQQGFPEKDCDGIIGPNTWGRMKSFINLSVNSDNPGDTTVSSATPPSIDNIPAFNRWYAQKIIDSMNAGIAGSNFHAKDQLESIAKGESVLNVDPSKRIIQILPVIYHIVENAKSENYKDIIIGSFIRKASDNGSCTGHCEGRCIDINFRGGSFENPDSTKMVIKILQYLNALPSQFKKSLGFGMPLQGDFFGHQNFKKFKSVDSSNLINPELRNLVFHLGIVFPDNNNHLHIQIRWNTDTSRIKHEDLVAGLHDENEIVQYVQQENLVNNLFDNYTLSYRLNKVRDWLPLLLFKVDDDLVAKLKSRNMYVQYAHNESYSNDLNTDFYRLRIYKYPVLNGVLMDARSLIKYIRLNINSLVDTDYCDFYPYDTVIDTPVWQSDNPKGAVLKLDIKGPDNASVVVSLAKPNGWRFTTVHTPATGAHPVSGNREFFIAGDSATGGTYFVIKGLDMMSSGIAGLGLPFFGGWGFKQADALWKSMRSKIINMINSNGGEASEDITYSERVEWRFVYYSYKNLLEATFGKGTGSPENSPFFDVSEIPEHEINFY